MKKLGLILSLALLACLMLAFTIYAEETLGDNGIYYSTDNGYGTVNIIEGYDYSSKLSLEQRMVLDNGDGTYSTYPSAYALNYNKDGSKRGERFQHFDPSILNDETGYTYSHASVIRYEIPEGITIIHHDDRTNINFNTCDNMVEVTFPSTLVTFTKGDFLNGAEALVTVDMSKCTSLKSMGGSTFANCPALKDVALGPAMTSLPGNAFQASGIETIEIPSNITTISQYAFYNCKSLTGITFHDGITSIGQKSFQYCTALLEAHLPAGLTAVPQDCFHGCTALTTVTMGENVTSMAGYVFNGCSALVSVTLSDNITTMGANCFSGCSSLVSITLPSKLTVINGNLFKSCTSLTSIDVPDTVTSIGSQAFYGCSVLASVEMSSNIASVGKEAFGYCKALTEITFPSSVTFVDQYVFKNCTALTTVTFEEGGLADSTMTGVFQSCSALVTVKLPNGISSIGTNAFNGCSSLTTIDGGLPSTVTSIGQNAFKGCTVLPSLGTLPSGITSVGQEAFNGCKALTEVTFSDGLLTISSYVFSNCTALVSVNIPDTVTSLGAYAFNSCSALTTVTISENSQIAGSLKGTFSGCTALTGFIIPRGVTRIEENTFRNCSSLTTIGGDLPSGVTYIGKECFNSCKLLTEIVLPNGLETIYDYAFTNCSGLTSIEIPDTVTYLGYYAFNGCSAITTISISENSQISGTWQGTFNNCKVLTSIYVPKGVTSFTYDVFSYCNAITSITLAEGLTTITSGNNFRNCSSLTSISLPNTLTSIADSNFGGCTALSEVRLGDSLTHLGAGNLTLKALKRVYIPASLTSVGTHLLGYTNSADSSTNITFIFTGSYAEAQAFRALVKADTANSANASKIYDAVLAPSSEYDVTEEPSGYHFVYNYSKCEAFYPSHTLVGYNACVDKCERCLHLYAVASPVHNFEGGEAIVYADFAQSGIKTNVCQNEGCTSNDGSAQEVAPIFTFYGYSIYEVGTSFCVNYTVDIDALTEYEETNGVTLDFGLVGAYVGYLNGGAPLDPTTAKAVDVSSTGKRIFLHSIRKLAQPNVYLRLTNIAEEEYEEEFYICMYIFDGKEVKYLTADICTSMPDPVSYAEVRGPIETTIGSMSYSTEEETTPAADRIKQQEYSNSVYNTGSELSSSELQGSGWFNTGILGKAKLIAAGGSFINMPAASALMNHYLDNTGTTYNLDVASFLSDDSGALTCRNTAINNALRAAEALAREGETLTVNQLAEGHPYQSQLATQNWQYALGSYFDDVDVENLTVTVVDGVKTYSASITYIVTDYYNWDTNDYNDFKGIVSPHELHELHKAGLAREFLTYGEISYNVTWTEGQTVSDLGI